ncbi:FrgA protein [Stigmatella aurantiaca]|uniref:FrgA protein n=1 Tax=Stigmatella aurantiaca (strain DW4/3-1) TaxID=378806 RepID=E3FRX7_STIAD|nr:FrgA protein [Stigmatella aurantiaca]ADO69512.1 FrgA protein [Stigmatella aurantiaca DW4/3-1]
MPARLAQFLVARGLLPQETAEAALRQQQTRGGAIDTALLELGVGNEASLLELLGEVSGYRPVNLADFEPNSDVATFIPPKIADRLCVVPLSLDGNSLHVACGYPVPRKELDEVGFLLGKPLELWVATELRVREWISAVYKQPLAPRFAHLMASLNSRPAAAPAQAPAPPPPPAEALDEEAALTASMVERLARSVATEPLSMEAKKTPALSPSTLPPGVATPPPAPPAYTREPLRLNMPANAPAGAAPSPPPRGPAAPAATPPPPAPPAYTREPLRLNMPASPPMPPPAPPPAYTREPLRLNMPAAPTPAPAASRPAASPAAAAPMPVPTGGPGPTTLVPLVVAPSAAPPGSAPVLPKPAEPQFLVFSNPTPAVPASRPRAAFPPEAPAAPASPPGAAARPPASPAQDVPDWTLAQARAALKEATRERERLIDVALRFGRRTFDYVAAFAVLRGTAVGWEARGEGLQGEPLAQVSIPLDAGSVFRTIAVTRGSYAGPLPPDALTRHYLELFGRQPPRAVFLYPVEVRGRLVALLYGDCGLKPVSQRRLSDYILFCQDLPSAFQELILFRKQRLTELRVPDTSEEAAPTGAAPVPAPAVVAGLGWSPFFGRASGTLGRAATMPPRVMSEERPPPDFAPLLRRLTGPDAAQRAHAMAELARTPEASARVLASSFPGPTAWSRLPVVELPEADELGPIPAALSRLGRPAAQALAPLLDATDADTRYLALLTAGNLPYVDLVDGVLRGLFDFEPDISSAARVAASALKHLPRFDAAMKELRQELSNRDPLRRSLAARALGSLHDRDAIEGLIHLTGGEDEMCAQAAAEALREVTRATFGLNPRQWMAWWVENRTRRRADWLVAALRHRELDVRLASIEELSRALNDTLGYYADAPEAEREAAVRRWEATAVDAARARRLGVL